MLKGVFEKSACLFSIAAPGRLIASATGAFSAFEALLWTDCQSFSPHHSFFYNIILEVYQMLKEKARLMAK